MKFNPRRVNLIRDMLNNPPWKVFVNKLSLCTV
jgi:hypothetical protein